MEHIRPDDDEILREVLRQLFPKSVDSGSDDILALKSYQNLIYEKTRCFSLKNENVAKDWKKFVDGLPDTKNKIVPNVDEKYWRWKMYKKYCPEERTDFRKKMKCGPGFDCAGPLPVPADDKRLLHCKDLTPSVDMDHHPFIFRKQFNRNNIKCKAQA